MANRATKSGDLAASGQTALTGRNPWPKRIVLTVALAAAIWILLYAALVLPPELRRWRNGIDAVAIGPAPFAYVLDDGETGEFLSDRDCGWVSNVAGTADDGTEVQRSIWGFCDSAGYYPDGRPWAMPFGFPTNTVAIADPSDAESAIVTPAFADVGGNPTALKTWIREGVPDNEPFVCDDGFTRHEWIRGMTTLPDDEPALETIIIFYQNYCASGTEIAYSAGGGGVALAQWDANDPDQPMAAERLNDKWFLPGLLKDRRLNDNLAAYTYGTGPLLASEGALLHLYIYMCGAAGDCTVARSPINPDRAGRLSAEALATTTNWRYRSETGWEPFPAPDRFGTCAPTAEDDCGGHPDPLLVSTSRRFDQYSQPGAEPSVKEVDGRYYLLYAPGFPSDVFVMRVADSPLGPFTDDRFIEMPDGHCEATCRVPIWHPELDTEDTWAFSYYDSGALTEDMPNLDREVGQINIAQIPASQ